MLEHFLNRPESAAKIAEGEMVFAFWPQDRENQYRVKIKLEDIRLAIAGCVNAH